MRFSFLNKFMCMCKFLLLYALFQKKQNIFCDKIKIYKNKNKKKILIKTSSEIETLSKAASFVANKQLGNTVEK